MNYPRRVRAFRSDRVGSPSPLNGFFGRVRLRRTLISWR
jgi:hypothetical protein